MLDLTKFSMGSELYNKKTKYHNPLRVVKYKNVITLLAGHGAAMEQGAIDFEDIRHHVHDYSLLAMGSLLFNPEPKNILIVGLGAGIVPREMFIYTEANIDIIEIDEDMVDVSKNFFMFSENDRTKVIVGDAYDVLKNGELNKKYDLIFVDAFLSDFTPLHLLCHEFIKLIKKVSSDNSVVAFNTCHAHHFYKSHLVTINSVFNSDIYRNDGNRNNYSTMLYVTNNKIHKKYDGEFFKKYENPVKVDMKKYIGVEILKLFPQ